MTQQEKYKAVLFGETTIRNTSTLNTTVFSRRGKNLGVLDTNTLSNELLEIGKGYEAKHMTWDQTPINRYRTLWHFLVVTRWHIEGAQIIHENIGIYGAKGWDERGIPGALRNSLEKLIKDLPENPKPPVKPAMQPTTVAAPAAQEWTIKSGLGNILFPDLSKVLGGFNIIVASHPTHGVLVHKTMREKGFKPIATKMENNAKKIAALIKGGRELNLNNWETISDIKDQVRKLTPMKQLPLFN